MPLSVSVENSQINIGRSLIDVPISSGSTEHAVNHSGLRIDALSRTVNDTSARCTYRVVEEEAAQASRVGFKLWIGHNTLVGIQLGIRLNLPHHA